MRRPRWVQWQYARRAEIVERWSVENDLSFVHRALRGLGTIHGLYTREKRVDLVLERRQADLLWRHVDVLIDWCHHRYAALRKEEAATITIAGMGFVRIIQELKECEYDSRLICAVYRHGEGGKEARRFLTGAQRG